MVVSCPCRLCNRRLDPAQQLRFHFETEAQTSPAYLELIRELPHVNGMPLRVCRGCQEMLERRPRVVRADRREFRSAVLATLGVVAVGWVFRAMIGGRA